ncbi:hypothetical protein BJX70DRAFT_364704 [Aspergillus crustosus]
MAEVQDCLPSKPLATGCQIGFFTKTGHTESSNLGSKPPSSEQFYTETSYDGKEGSQVFEIPLHWHKHHEKNMHVIEGEAYITIENRTILV